MSSRVLASVVMLLAVPFAAAADSPGRVDVAGRSVPPAAVSKSKPRPQPSKTTEKNFIRHLILDQQSIWSAPAHVQASDSAWIAPLSAVTAGLFASDAAASAQLSRAPQRLRRSHEVADAGVASLAGAAAGLYLWGKIDGDAHRQETGLLAAEAAINSTGVAEVLKFATRRERPREGNGQGHFFTSGSSFPSEHAVAAWSIASVLAHEYPGPLTKLLAYGAASAVSFSRITSHDHFPSDVLVGSTLGWLIGRQVYRAHHDPDLAGAKRWGTFSRREGEAGRDPGMVASTYVPLDSWVYPAFERLQGLGYARSGMPGLRPWTRMECARLLREAGDALAGEPTAPPEAASLYRALKTEFLPEFERDYEQYQLGATIESIYSRVSGISGPPLNDGYHFAQTTTNDFGRTTREGVNVVSGVSARASAGPLTFYFRGEYQHAPSAPAYSDAVGAAVAQADYVPYTGKTATPQIDRLRLLDAYASINVKNFQISFGNQSLWWGPGYGGTMLFTDNAEPITMLRIDRVSPFELPGPLRWLGKVRLQAFWGSLQGYKFVTINPHGTPISISAPIRPHPWIDGEKLSFAPTPNLQFAISVTNVFGGPGFPLTLHTFLRSYGISNTVPGLPNDPGDRRSSFEFSYRIPGLRNWFVLYSDSLSEDEFSPIAYPRRSAMNPGIYLPQIPGARNLDLRVEAVYTDMPNTGQVGIFYSNYGHYNSGYTNQGNIIGSWVGRQAWGLQTWSTYWLSPQNTVQVGFRKQLVNRAFLGGGDVRDFNARANLALRPGLQVRASAQYERWAFPLLAPAAKSNLMMSVELSWHPRWGLHR